MGTIINYKSFVEPIYLDTSDVEVQNVIDLKYCPLVEKEILTKLLGETLYNDFKDKKTEAKYATLINGDNDTFVYSGKTKLYTGLKDMLTYFTYFYYLRKSDRKNSRYGQTRPKLKNEEFISSNEDLVFAWNKGVDLFNEAIDYINYKNQSAITYSDFDPEYLDYVNTWNI